jgi:hypothetical protein
MAGLGRAAEMFFARKRVEIDQLANDHGVCSIAADSAARPSIGSLRGRCKRGGCIPANRLLLTGQRPKNCAAAISTLTAGGRDGRQSKGRVAASG